MSVLQTDTQVQVEQKLIEQGFITAEKLMEIKLRAQEKNEPFMSFLISQGLLQPEQLTKAIAEVTHVPYVNLTNAHVNPKTLSLLSEEVARRYMAVPLGEMQNRLVVAMIDANNVQAVDFLSNKIGRPLKVYLASEEGIRNVLRQYQTDLEKDIAGAFKGDDDKHDEGDMHDSDTIQAVVQDSPISKALSAIMEYAVKNRASDIHVEPLEKELKIRCRIDGVLREVMRLPKSSEAPLVSRIKILSSLKIDEHRVPQDGQFSIRVADKDVDLRIAISPVVWGEQVVIRLLDKSGTSLKLEDMGYTGRALRTIREGLKRPNGMILTSGPTGSGKSTSLYALLQEIKDDTVNIVTLEDPVEYKMGGINQIQVNADVGLTFASGLRSILRQDPDIVMVGEIRDKETATLAVQAALTGHLVFSTLHTNSAAGILPRLLDMGIEPFLIASTVHTVIGQRLVRKIPKDGRDTYNASKPEIEAIHKTIGHLLPKDEASRKAVSDDLGWPDLPLGDQKAYTLTRGVETPDRPGGFKGRIGLYEVFGITDEIQQLILQRAPSSEIQDVAIKQGMVTMREDGYFKALSGLTTIDEVNRVAAEDSA